MERFAHKKLNDEQYRVKISNTFSALDSLHDNVDFSRAWRSTV
jgi:hypothetical protein